MAEQQSVDQTADEKPDAHPAPTVSYEDVRDIDPTAAITEGVPIDSDAASGETTVVRVSEYTNETLEANPWECVYAYRIGDRDEHVVVKLREWKFLDSLKHDPHTSEQEIEEHKERINSRPGQRTRTVSKDGLCNDGLCLEKTKTVPAERHYPLPNTGLWTIPDNWEGEWHEEGGGLFRTEQSIGGVWVRVEPNAPDNWIEYAQPAPTGSLTVAKVGDVDDVTGDEDDLTLTPVFDIPDFDVDTLRDRLDIAEHIPHNITTDAERDVISEVEEYIADGWSGVEALDHVATDFQREWVEEAAQITHELEYTSIGESQEWVVSYPFTNGEPQNPFSTPEICEIIHESTSRDSGWEQHFADMDIPETAPKDHFRSDSVVPVSHEFGVTVHEFGFTDWRDDSDASHEGRAYETEAPDNWSDLHVLALVTAVKQLQQDTLSTAFENQFAYRVGIDSDYDTLPYDEGYYLSGLLESGCSPAEATDYIGVYLRNRTQQEWADFRGVTQSTVSQNVNEAEHYQGASFI